MNDTRTLGELQTLQHFCRFPVTVFYILVAFNWLSSQVRGTFVMRDLIHVTHLLYMCMHRFLQDSDTDVNFNKLCPFVAHSSLHSRQWKPNMSIINSNTSPEFMKVEERIESEPLPAKMVHPIQALSNNLVLTISHRTFTKFFVF